MITGEDWVTAITQYGIDFLKQIVDDKKSKPIPSTQ
jgi:hypothetical protein